jgi:glycosyltransferase involved in cell wall biosynthesis
MELRSHADSDRRLRVLFIPQRYPQPGVKLVSGTFCREHVLAAARYDDVAVLVYSPRAQKWPTLHWKRTTDTDVPVFYATYGHSFIPKTTRPFFYLHLYRAIRRAIGEWVRPDIIHTQDAYAYYVIKAIQRLKIPAVFSQHWGGFMRRELDAADVRRFRWAFRHAARVLPANKFFAADYNYYGLTAQTTWLPNTVDTQVFYPPAKSMREPWLLHASGFTPEKQVPDIIAAFARVCSVRPEAILQVAGDGPNRAKMETLATRELPPGSFKFHGFLSKRDLATLMRRASGFIFPSKAETFGCVLMEAMACGCPVLTTRAGGIPAVVREGDGLFVDVGNIDQIAEGMISLLADTHGLDMDRISRETCERFSHEVVGHVLHQEHVRAAGLTNQMG